MRQALGSQVGQILIDKLGRLSQQRHNIPLFQCIEAISRTANTENRLDDGQGRARTIEPISGRQGWISGAEVERRIWQQD